MKELTHESLYPSPIARDLSSPFSVILSPSDHNHFAPLMNLEISTATLREQVVAHLDTGQDLVRTLKLLGCPSTAALDRSYIETPGQRRSDL